MAIHLEDFLDRATIRNTERGVVTGEIWIIGREAPIHLDLKGDFLRDLAGCEISLESPDPLDVPEDWNELKSIQRGAVGDITASRRVHVLSEDLDEDTGLVTNQSPTIANGLLVEWFNEDGERVVIDSISLDLRIEDQSWQMTKDEETKQTVANHNLMKEYIDRVAGRVESTDVDSGQDPRPLDEFEWEERLKESDRITDAYLEALDKYRDDSDQEEKVADLMGWDHLSDADDGLFEEEDEFESLEFDGEDFEEGDEEAEDGFDDPWDDKHPLYERVRTFSLRIHREAQELGFIRNDDSEGVNPVQDVVFAAMELGAKLAGALNGLSRDIDPEPGLVVAWLKRGLPIIDRALAACEEALEVGEFSSEWIEGARKEFFEVRDSMLDLIQEFRKGMA
ncbi:MAG: hypothetical protein AAGA58_15960 [Verrucomicrobiota bacterium]